MKTSQTRQSVKTTLLMALIAFTVACGYSAKMTPPVAGAMPAIAATRAQQRQGGWRRVHSDRQRNQFWHRGGGELEWRCPNLEHRLCERQSAHGGSAGLGDRDRRDHYGHRDQPRHSGYGHLRKRCDVAGDVGSHEFHDQLESSHCEEDPALGWRSAASAATNLPSCEGFSPRGPTASETVQAPTSCRFPDWVRA